MTWTYTKKDSDEIKQTFYKHQRKLTEEQKLKKIITNEEKEFLKKIGRPTDKVITVEEFKKKVRQIYAEEHKQRAQDRNRLNQT
jgi:hypothetical protein